VETSTAQAQGFHHSRLAATPTPTTRRQLHVGVREASTDEELWACSRLRSVSFYVYPPDRKFAGQLHQKNMAKEEFEALCTARADMQKVDCTDRAACLIAVAAPGSCPDVPPDLMLPDGAAVVGSLDLCAVRALPGEVLIGDSSNSAYLSNVCVAEAARRCSVGGLLLRQARSLAKHWGVDDLLVIIMAANQSARQFYESNGFYVLKEESPDRAHHRGRCLDGISGGGRTLLLRDSLL